MKVLKLLGRCVGYYILMRFVITLLIVEQWRTFLVTLTNGVILLAFLIALVQLLFGGLGENFLNRVWKRVAAALIILIAMMAILGYGLYGFSAIFT